MKIIISYSLLATLLTLTALATLVEAQGVNLTLYTAKNIYVPEDTILITAELHKTEDSPVQVVLESFLTNKRGTFVTMPTHLSLELGPSETRVITLYDITVDSYFYSDEYIVSARLLIDDEVIQSQELHFFVEETLSEFILNLYTCKDNACLERSKIFILDETIYLDYESDVPNLTVTANLSYPDKSVRELTLPISIAVSQIGPHQLEIIASKEGYRTIIKKVLFAVIEREAHIPVIQICNGNGICDENENYENCPQDCPPKPIPGDLDGDGVPDGQDNCPENHNPKQIDSDGDGQGNPCDPCPSDPHNDVDKDGICGDVDNCESTFNPDQADIDHDGIGDACDTCTDTDGDTYGNPGYPSNTCVEDNCPDVYNPSQEDYDSDGIGDVCDPDDDNDGISDDQDSCPYEDSTGFDADRDGCIDTFSGLFELLDTLVTEGVIAEEMQKSLTTKVGNAEKSSDKENLCAATNQLKAFKHEVNAQRGKKISDEAADLVVEYADNLIETLWAKLPPGETC